MDFTIAVYKKFLESILAHGFEFQAFSDFINQPAGKAVILRHDVDKMPFNSLATAKLENQLGIKGTYYFRSFNGKWEEPVIIQIAALGHEVGYHYESLATCNGNPEKAYHDFTMNLEKLRSLAPVTSICMHGSPRSKWDSRDLWETYSYKNLGIVGEPYFDIDFSRVFYLTDTGRRWDGFKTSRRDKIPVFQEIWEKTGLVFHNTDDIIRAIEDKRLKGQMMITVHPQRWNDQTWPWLMEFIKQNVKNAIKRCIVK